MKKPTGTRAHCPFHQRAADGRGARFGRPIAGDPSERSFAPCVGRVPLSDGGYDPGGAYWGDRRPGEAIYCFWTRDQVVIRYIDAPSLPAALEVFRASFPNAVLA